MDKVVIATLEVGVLLLLDYNDEVTIDATMTRCVTHALHGECETLVYASGNLNLHNLVATLCALATAVGTLILDDATLAMT